jgi:hypothetical protein
LDVALDCDLLEFSLGAVPPPASSLVNRWSFFNPRREEAPEEAATKGVEVTTGS